MGQNQYYAALPPFGDGSRVIEKVPCGRWETTTFLEALRATGLIAPLAIDGLGQSHIEML